MGAKSEVKTKSVRITPRNHERLRRRGTKGDTYNDIIEHLLDITEPKPVEVSQEVLNDLKEADKDLETGKYVAYTMEEFKKYNGD